MGIQCKVCDSYIEDDLLKKSKYICPYCKAYQRIGAYQRISMITDKNSFDELFTDIEDANPLKMQGYEEKLALTREKTGIKEAVVTGTAKVYGEKIVLAICDSSFLMGSMGHVVGEKVTRSIEYAIEHRLPIFIFCCSGGARMQEGTVALMQMEKTAAVMKKHHKAGLFSCTILTNPTTGGVTASFATLGDVIMAEPGALIGFAGPRVIEQTMRQKLPVGFQSAEFQEKHGMVDGIVERKNLKKVIQFLCIANNQSFEPQKENRKKKIVFPTALLFNREIRSKLQPWERVKLQRSTQRISALSYIRETFDIFVELKGDRYYGNDKAIVGGIALFDGRPVTVIADNRGDDANEMMQCNYGMPLPEGYRKALRLMKEAEKFRRPIISFINTPGAHCGMEAEERGQGWAISQNLFEMSDLKVPVLAIITGEAGSGGALATAVANEVWMMENATYSVISPEGYASIVWKDSSKAMGAVRDMHIAAEDLKKLGVIEKIIPEYRDNENSIQKTSEFLKKEIHAFLDRMSGFSEEEIAEDRYKRFRKF